VKFCGIRRRFVVANCLVALAIGHVSHAESSPQAQHDNSDAAKIKKKPKGDAKRSAAKTKHPGVTIGDALTIDFTGRLDGDVRQATPALGFDAPEPAWQDRRVGVKGTAFKRISFEVSRELGQDLETSNGLSEKTAWRDVYARARVTRALSIQAGRFKLPFGYEELTGETDLDFIYRSLASRVLAPGRDAGVMLDGRLGARRIEYAVGYFTRDGDNGRTSQTEGGRDAVAGRVTIAPFASSKATTPLTVGVSVARSHLDDELGLRGRTVLGDGIFFDRSYVSGTRQRIGLDASWARGPASASGEYIWDGDQRLGIGFDGERVPTIRASAWYAAGTWALTGERKHGRLLPQHDFLEGGLGAFELVARYDTLRFHDASYPGTGFGFPASSSLSANSDRATTAGLNWYLNRYVKVQGNVSLEAIADPARSPAPSTHGRFASAVLRFQFRV
jgi:phosphate-selective porin OprO and OprP